MDQVTVIVALVLVLALAWVALELRALHDTMLPVARLSNSPVLQAFAGPSE